MHTCAEPVEEALLFLLSEAVEEQVRSVSDQIDQLVAIVNEVGEPAFQ